MDDLSAMTDTDFIAKESQIHGFHLTKLLGITKDLNLEHVLHEKQEFY